MSNEILGGIWSEWQLEEKPLGKGSFGTVYKAVRRDHNVESRAAIKVIAIPSDPSEVDSLLSEGLTVASAKTYLEGVVNDFVGEIQLMESLKATPNIVSVEDYKVVEGEDGLSWTVFIRMELLTPFTTYIRNKPLTEEDVIKLGCDICSALEICEKRNIIHRDIKPENIFINDFGYFKLGDFGIARRMENLTGGLSQKGTFNYMAPEVASSNTYDARVDIYSLGVVLYRLVNGNRLPFIENESQVMNPNARRNAVERRLRGERLTPPCDASPELADVILRACEYDPELRFKNATEMKKALTAVSLGVYVIPAASDGMDKTVSVRKVNTGAVAGVAAASAASAAPAATATTAAPTAPAATVVRGIKAEPKVEPKVEPKAEPKVEPKAEPKVETKVPDPNATVSVRKAEQAHAKVEDPNATVSVRKAAQSAPRAAPRQGVPVTQPSSFGEYDPTQKSNKGKIALIVALIAIIAGIAILLPGLFSSEDKADVTRSHIHNYVDGVCVCGAKKDGAEAHVHNFVDGICDCGDRYSVGLEFEYLESAGGYSVKSLGSCKDSSVIIPATYNGKPVIAIGEYAFSECSTITSISIPNNVTRIGDYAFSRCTSLGTVTVSNSVERIGMGAFYYCGSLTRITFNGSEDQWNSIRKGVEWDAKTGLYTVYCT